MSKKSESAYYVLGSKHDLRLRAFEPAQASRSAGEREWPPACRLCGKFEDLDYLDAGCSRMLDPAAFRADFAYTRDIQLVVSSRVREVLHSVPGARFHAYPVGAVVDPTHWILHPTQQIHPPEPVPRRKKGNFQFPAHTPFLSHGDKCAECGRYREVTFGHEWLPIEEGTVLAGVALEGPCGPRRWRWIGNGEVAASLKQAGIAGLHLEPLEKR